MKKIVALGEVLVEIMATESGQSFRTPGYFIGPYPSGAPAIFIDQVARLNYPCGIISCVGNDDFGHLNIDRLKKDGVDVSAINIISDSTTGSAFVTYKVNGERDFIFNITNSACAHISLTAAGAKLLQESSHFHIMGSSLFSSSMVESVKMAVDTIKNRGGTVSFDPNIRKEILSLAGMRETLDDILRQTDIFLPSGQEIAHLTDAANEDDAIEEILGIGVREIVIKRGNEGCSYFDRTQRLSMPAYVAEEVDPTGAGDCFGGTFVTCRLMDMPVGDALRYANASGAIAVSRKGPMEGTSTFDELDEFLSRNN
ncbi:sugar kinase [Alkalispirochaeta odontotermitis]|nr:sugar kinase [Alkalispirochaeta odontotermitis]CAB1074936.1 D-tagatose 6-kinase (EC [Olavius algarvensis Delta 1 endosymbiont]